MINVNIYHIHFTYLIVKRPILSKYSKRKTTVADVYILYIISEIR